MSAPVVPEPIVWFAMEPEPCLDAEPEPMEAPDLELDGRDVADVPLGDDARGLL